LRETWRLEHPHDTPPSSRQPVTNFRAWLRFRSPTGQQSGNRWCQGRADGADSKNNTGQYYQFAAPVAGGQGAANNSTDNGANQNGADDNFLQRDRKRKLAFNE